MNDDLDPGNTKGIKEMGGREKCLFGCSVCSTATCCIIHVINGLGVAHLFHLEFIN